MLTQTPFASLNSKLNLPGAGFAPALAVPIELSPPLVLAAALLYMMLSNGEVEKAEIDQLQSVIGKNADLLRCAVDYVQSVPVDQFIVDAPSVLGDADRLCVLTNMCDAMLSDGQTDAAELDLLAQLAASFGLSDEEFQPFYEAMALKNDKTVLGRFDAAKLAAQQATPHLAMAASLIYMMASDGSLGPEEIGRLQAMIGEFEGLQKVAVKYALKVKSEQFFASAGRFLNDDQKIFILANVCDIMLADGVIFDAEKVVFQNMRNAFGFSEEEFEPFHTAISTKNLKSFDTDSFTYVRDSRLADGSESDDIFSGGGISFGTLGKTSGSTPTAGQFGSTVSRAMRANVVSVSSDFGSTKKLNRISINSTFHASAEREGAALQFKAGADETPQDLFSVSTPSQPRGRRPIAGLGRAKAMDHSQNGIASNDPKTSQTAEPERDTHSTGRRNPARLPAFGARPAPGHRTRRPLLAKHDHHIKTKAAADLGQVRHRLQHSHAVNAVIRQQLDHYDATGELVRLPMPVAHVATQQVQVSTVEPATTILAPEQTRQTDAASFSAALTLPAIPALPVWRIAVPVAVLVSALMGGTAIMAGLAAPQAASDGTEAISNQASLHPSPMAGIWFKQS